jgi:hypothetical protein
MIKRLTLATALLVLCLFAAPRPVAAYDFFSGANCGNKDNSGAAACQSQPQTDSNGQPIDPLTGPNGTLAHITNIVAYASGAAAIIIIMVSALKLITSGSDVSTGSRTDTDVEDARRSIANAVIGLVIIVLARTLLIYVINRL